MTIKRVVNGTEMEFELTSLEMWEAYNEQEHEYDIDDIKDRFDGIGSAADIAEVYDMPWTEIEPLIPEMAYRYRRYMEKYSDDWVYQRDEAIADVLSEHR